MNSLDRLSRAAGRIMSKFRARGWAQDGCRKRGRAGSDQGRGAGRVCAWVHGHSAQVRLLAIRRHGRDQPPGSQTHGPLLAAPLSLLSFQTSAQIPSSSILLRRTSRGLALARFVYTSPHPFRPTHTVRFIIACYTPCTRLPLGHSPFPPRYRKLALLSAGLHGKGRVFSSPAHPRWRRWRRQNKEATLLSRENEIIKTVRASCHLTHSSSLAFALAVARTCMHATHPPACAKTVLARRLAFVTPPACSQCGRGLHVACGLSGEREVSVGRASEKEREDRRKRGKIVGKGRECGEEMKWFGAGPRRPRLGSLEG
jgi:hypothetical protein